MTPIVLVGPGGHCRSCIDVLEATKQYQIMAVVGREDELGQAVLGHSIGYVDDDIPELARQHGNFLVTVGQIKSNALRVRLFNTIKSAGGHLPSIVSPLAHVASSATLAEGTIVMHLAMVNAAAQVGLNCIVNSRALIEHDAQVGDHCHVSTGAILNGNAIVGQHCFIGSGAIVHQGVTIEHNVIVGSGALVTQGVKAKTLLPSGERW